MMMKPDTVKLYQRRLDEGYDLESDELYLIWSKLRTLSLDSPAASDVPPKDKVVPEASPKVSPALSDIITYPELPGQKKKGKATSSMPKHLSSDQVIDYLEAKKQEKQRELEEKEKRKLEQEKKNVKMRKGEKMKKKKGKKRNVNL